MIARDAEDVIAASLDSIRNIADEIIVVDTGSADRTRDVAMSRASRVLDFEWCEDFAAARNFCLEHATGDWVLWLDAGETLAAEDAAALRALVDSGVDGSSAYLAMVKMPPAGREMAAEQIARIRLHPRRSGLEFTGRVREEIQTAIEALEMSIELAPFSLYRSSRDLDANLKRRRAERNVHLAALEVQDHGVLPAPLLAMADACIALGHVTQGIEFYSRVVQIAPRGSTHMLEAFYGLLAALDQVPGARQKQLSLCEQALSLFPFDAQLLCAMGNYLQLQGRIDLACRSFETAMRYGQVDPQTWHLVEIAEVATVCHATCQDLLGQSQAARETIESAVNQNPASQRLQRQLLELYIRHDLRKEALELAGRLSTGSQRDALRSAVRGACLAAKQSWVPAIAYLQTAFGAGCRDVICWRALMTAYLATGDLRAARQTLAKWQEEQPASAEVANFRAQLTRHHPAENVAEVQSLPSASGSGHDSSGPTNRYRVDAPQRQASPPPLLSPEMLPHSATDQSR
jgi:tetratricopeptide (TPR) repeat protein